MYKKLHILFALMLAALHCLAGELILNGDFKDGRQHWNVSGETPASFTQNDDGGLLFRKEADGYVLLYQNIDNVAPGEYTFSVTVDLKGDNGTAFITPTINGNASDLNNIYTFIPVKDGRQTISKKFNVDENTSRLQVRFGGSKTGAIFYKLSLVAAVPKAIANDDALPQNCKKLPLPCDDVSIHTLSYIKNAHFLFDGDTATVAQSIPGTGSGQRIVFDFGKPCQISAVRFFQNFKGSEAICLEGDAKGDGDFASIAQWKAQKGNEPSWISFPVNGNYSALRLVDYGKKGTYGGVPCLPEIELYVPQDASVAQITAPEDDTAKAGLKPVRELEFPAGLKKRCVDIRVSIDAWNMGYGVKAPVPENLSETPRFKDMVAKLHQLDVNAVNFFPEVGCSNDWMPWKSDALWPGRGDDFLPQCIAALKKEGIPLYFWSHAWIAPIQRYGRRAAMPYARWDYPYEQSDRNFGNEGCEMYIESYPCVLMDSDYRDKWTQILREVMAMGAEGSYLMPDEWYFKGHELKSACPKCRETFEKESGMSYDDVLKLDSSAYRQWKLFEYRKHIQLYSQIAKDIKREFPNAELIACDCQLMVEHCSGRLEHNLPGDLFTNIPETDTVELYGQSFIPEPFNVMAFTRRRAAGAGYARLHRAIQWPEINSEKKTHPVRLFAALLGPVITGARVVEHYRLSYMLENGWEPLVKECHSLVRLLESWNIDKFRTPSSVALLYSRASEDRVTMSEGLREWSMPEVDRAYRISGEHGLPKITTTDGRSLPLLDAEVAIFPMVYHGFAIYNTFASSVNAFPGSKEYLINIAMGGVPLYYYYQRFAGKIWDDVLHYTTPERIAHDVKLIKQATMDMERLAPTVTKCITNIAMVSFSVFETDFEDGTRLYVNLSKLPAEISPGISLPPRNFLVVAPE